MMEPPTTGRLHSGVRRPIKARSSSWAAALASYLVRRRVTPDAISVASVLFAAAGAFLVALTRFDLPPWLLVILYLLTVVAIQGRLVCNLLDGMVAVEGGRGGPLGEIYNDLPDRLADPILLVATGYGAGLPYANELGWLAAVGSLLTAYVRMLGRSIGAGTYFTGPMAKQHRMGVLTGSCVAAAVGAPFGLHRWILLAGLLVIALGCVWTCVRRLRLISAALRRVSAKLETG